MNSVFGGVSQQPFAQPPFLFRSLSGSLTFGHWITVAAFISAGGCAPATDRQVPMVVDDSLVGTWRVIAHLQPVGSDSLASHPVRGYLVYDQTGHVFVQVIRRDTADSLSVRRWFEVPDSMLKNMVDGFRAYFGTYHVDDSARMVTHRIEGEFLPRRGLAEVATPFDLRGDTLMLGADSSERWTFVRVRK
jgi:hypothetical protein